MFPTPACEAAHIGNIVSLVHDGLPENGLDDVFHGQQAKPRSARIRSAVACQKLQEALADIGLAHGIEHFDPVGAWREQDAGQPVDASAQLNGLEELGDGQVVPFGSVPELGAILAGTQAAPDCFARHYFRFTHGRLETEADDCALQTLTEHFAEAEHDIVSLVIATLTAPEFRYRQ